MELSLNSSYQPGSSLNSTSLELDFSTSFDVQHQLNKFNNDPDKLQIHHTGCHGVQLGTLITRHYLRSDSKCIQCNSCGIFFTPTTFLLHSHDEYGKRIPCNAVQLQLNIDHPSIIEKQKWNEFQKKLHSVNNTRMSKSLSRQSNHHNKDELKKCADAIEKEVPKLNGLKKYSSTSSIHLLNSHSSKLDKLLSLSDLKSDKFDTTKNSNWKDIPTTEKLVNDVRDLKQFAPIMKPLPLAPRTNIIKPRNETLLRPSSTFMELQNYDIKAKTAEDRFKPITQLFERDSHLDNKKGRLHLNPLGLISEAAKLLDQAKENLANYQQEPQGPMTSSAWRKMYEEEREHRMTLEARVRTLERELRVKKF